MAVDPQNPGAGEPWAIRVSAAAREQKAARLRGAQTAVSLAVADASGPGWTGDTQTAFTGAIATTTPDLVLLADGLEAQAAALRSYADQVQHIKDQQTALEVRRDDLDGSLATARAQWLQATQEANGHYVTDQVAARRADALSRDIGDLKDDIAGVAAGWDGLVADRARADAVCVAALSTPAVLGRLAVFAGAITPSGQKLLDLLTGLSATDLKALLTARPDLLEGLAGADAEAVARWWSGMNGTGGEISAAQAALILLAPRVIGNLEGVAYRARDQANRMVLEEELAAAKAAVSAAEEMPSFWDMLLGGERVMNAHALEYAAARERLEHLRGIAAALAVVSSTGPRSLVSFSGGPPALGAVAISDLDTASTVTFAVPGMGSTGAGMLAWATSAENIYVGQARLDGSAQHAVVAWIGYEAPGVPPTGGFGVLGTELASAGGDRLASALQGFDAVRTDQPRLNVLAHSYGTTTSAFALTQPGVHVDAFISIGSAGLPAAVTSAGALHATEVYAGQAQDVIPFLEAGSGDQWAWVGRGSTAHPVNPIDVEFGATRFGVDGGAGYYAVTDHSTAVSAGEGYGYLDLGTESLENVALAAVGAGQDVSAYADPGLTDLQQAWIDSLTRGGAPYVR